MHDVKLIMAHKYVGKLFIHNNKTELEMCSLHQFILMYHKIDCQRAEEKKNIDEKLCKKRKIFFLK